jgi:carboxyl-terminal processing protease
MSPSRWSMMTLSSPVRCAPAVVAAAALMLLVGCGGGSSGNPGSAACDVASQNTWLRDYMFDTYFWSGASPNPEPGGYDTVQKYFDALRFAGAGAVPSDRWSYISDSASFSQFFSEGKTLGYGLFVNGLEFQLPLKVRFVEAQSPAAAQGLLRGDQILAINGRSAADIVAANDFAVLSPAKEGDVLSVQIAGAAGPRTVVLTAATYTLTPVPVARVLTLANGAKAGYLVLKDFITQSEAPLAAAFNDFRAAGASELILDLRYNGGGRVSTANVLASLVAGTVHNGKVFTSLSYSAKQSSRNTSYALAASQTGFARVVVLTGERTCSASELVVNGLKPHVQVVTVGAQSCGKPFGFNPTNSCSSTFSAVNFESLNAAGQGRYYDGIAATCAVSEDFNGALGDPAEKLTAAAASYLQTGVCPVVVAAAQERARALAVQHRARAAPPEPGERRGMWIAD